MITDIFRIIEKYHMIEPGMRVIAGVSGGADSVCLLYALLRYRREVPFTLLAVHVEHGLRGQESLEDAAFVEKLCSGYGIPCRVEHVQVRELARAEGLSCEEAGRLARYRIFADVQKEWHADRIAVAHNRGDQAETVLWNLARGSGLKGLGGIRPVRGDVIRPLLFTDREEIETILRDAGLTWRTDRTNMETDYTRNRLRLSILPQMEADLNSRASRHIAEAGMRLQEVQAFLEKLTDAAAGRCIAYRDGDVCVLLEAFRKEEPLLGREVLLRALELCGAGHGQGQVGEKRNLAETAPGAEDDNSSCTMQTGVRKDIGAVHVEMLERLAEQDCGKSCSLPGGIRAVREERYLRFRGTRAVREEKCLRFRELREETYLHTTGDRLLHLDLPVPGSVAFAGIRVTVDLLQNEFGAGPKVQIQGEKKYTKWLSYDTISSNVQFRTRRTGDYLVINAAGGKKKLKDWFIDRKIPRSQRDRILLLADGSHILWIVGDRISEAVKITPETKRIIRIQMEESNEGKGKDPAARAGGGSEDCRDCKAD